MGKEIGAKVMAFCQENVLRNEPVQMWVNALLKKINEENMGLLL